MTAKEIYLAFINAGMTPQGACGLMGNLQAESSGIRSANAEGWSDEQDKRYTAETDAGTNNFVYDGIGYGIVQWTWWSRKKNLLEFAKSSGVSIGDLAMQVDFCIYELQNSYKDVWKLLCSTNNLYEATEYVCKNYEKPKVNNVDERYEYAENFYKEFVNSSEITNSSEKEETALTENEAIAKLIATAKAEVGYLEKRSNSQLDDPKANAGSNNWNKYAAFIDSTYPNFYNGRKNGFAWCDVFVDWCFLKCFGYEKTLKLLCADEKSTGAGCSYSARFFRSNGQFFNSPKVGDQVFFGQLYNEGHTGIVIAVDGDFITTVEGNTSAMAGVDANGDGVYMKRYNTKTQYIPGYGRPDWSIVGKAEGNKDTSNDSVKDDVDVNYPTIKRGDKGDYVKKAQKLLIAKGFSCGSAGADGDFGSGTYSAVIAFQKANNLSADGIIGTATWEKLLEDDKTTTDSSAESSTETESNCTVELPVLKKGAKGFPVLAVQILMSKQNVSVKYTDGDFGADTLAKVQLFQKNKGLTADGIIGSKTWNALLKG